MAKTKQIGVRFDTDLLEVLKEDKIADSPQKVLNFLTEFYKTNRERIDFKKMLEESKLFQPSDNEVKQKGFKKEKKENKKKPDIKDGMPDPSNKGAYLQWLRTNK